MLTFRCFSRISSDIALRISRRRRAGEHGGPLPFPLSDLLKFRRNGILQAWAIIIVIVRVQLLLLLAGLDYFLFAPVVIIGRGLAALVPRVIGLRRQPPEFPEGVVAHGLVVGEQQEDTIPIPIVDKVLQLSSAKDHAVSWLISELQGELGEAQVPT